MESSILLRSRWTNAAHEAAFRARYQSMGQSLLGCTVLKGKDGSGSGGILHWRACLGVICLHEESVDLDLVDNSAQFRYGDSHIGLPISVQVDFSYSSTGDKVCQVRILVKDASLCFVNLCSGGNESLLSAFVNLGQGHTIDIPSESYLRQSSPYNGRNRTAFCSPADRDLSIICGCVTNNFAAVGLPDGDIAFYDISSEQDKVKIVGKRTITVSGSEKNMNIFQKWFSAPAPLSPQAANAKELISLQCIRNGNILSLSKSGKICIIDCHECAILAELDFLHILQKQYPILAGDACIEDFVIAICKDECGCENTDETTFATGYCVKVTSDDGMEHLEWHVVVSTLTMSSSLVWRVIDYGNAYAPLSRCSLLDLHMSRRSDGSYQLDSKWRNDSAPSGTGFLLLNTTFTEIDSSPSIALQCSSMVTKLHGDTQDENVDSTIAVIIKSNGGWQSGLNRRISVDQAATAVKMIRLQRLFRPGRFSLSTIVDTLMHDVPVPFAHEQFESEDFDLPLVIKLVCRACEEWARMKMEGEFDDFDDNVCENFSEFLDLCLTEFTGLCHARKTSERVRSSRGSLGVFPLLHGCYPISGCSTFSIVSDHHSLTLVPVLDSNRTTQEFRGNSLVEREDIDAMLGLDFESEDRSVLQLVDEAVPNRSFMELDILFSKFCLESPEIDTNILSWVIQQGNIMASMINDQVATQLDSIVSDQRVVAGLFESIDSLTRNPITAAEHQVQSMSGAETTTSAFKSSIKESIAWRFVDKEYQELKKMLVLFSYLCSTRCQATGSNISAIQSTYLSRVVHSFVYTGLIRWFSTVRPSDSTDLRRLFDLDDLFPSSHILSKRKPSSRNFIDISTLNQSVFGNFWKSSSFVKSHSQNVASFAHNCRIALRPSCMGDFTHYLLQDGNFSCLQRLAALLDIRLESEVNGGGFLQSAAKEGAELLNFATEVLRSRIRTMICMAGFYENLRLYAVKARNGIELISSDDSKIKDSFEALLKTFPLDEDGARMPFSDTSEILVDDSQESESSVEVIRDQLRTAISHLMEGLDDDSVSFVHRDAMTCLEDVMLRIIEESTLFREVVRIYAREDRLALLFAQNSAFLRRLIAINHIKDTLEVAKRARVVLQHNTGSEMSLNGNYMLMNYIKKTMETYGDLLDSYSALNSLMMTDYVNSWGRIFNAALESNSLDEALSAVVRMVELDDEVAPLDRIGMIENVSDKLVQPWQVCLRSLVTLACESGELQWLCNVPEIKIGLISLTDCIITELSRLSKSRSTVRALSASGKTTEINYGECLFCFQLNRGVHSDAAAALYDYTNRLLISDDSSKTNKGNNYIDLSYRSRALAACLCVFNQMEQSQAFFLTHKSSSKMLKCVAPSDIEYEFLCLSAATMIQRAFPKAWDDFEGLIVALCETREWECVHLALHMCHRTIAICKKKDRRDDLSLSTVVSQEALLRCFCHAIDAFVSISADEVLAQRVANIDEYTPYSHPCDSLPSRSSPFRFLIDTLYILDNNELNWVLHRTAAKKILSLRPSSEALPEILVSSFLSKPGAVNSLLSLLIECGHLSEACSIATHIIETASKSSNNDDKRVCIPYDLLDRLLAAAQGTLLNFSPASSKEKEDLIDLREGVNSLESLVLSYFKERISM